MNNSPFLHKKGDVIEPLNPKWEPLAFILLRSIIVYFLQHGQSQVSGASKAEH